MSHQGIEPSASELKRLRSRCRGKVREDGVVLVLPFRGEPDARETADLVRKLGGDVWEVRKVGQARFIGDRTWRLAFSVGIDEDLYLAGRIGLRQYRDLRAGDA